MHIHSNIRLTVLLLVCAQHAKIVFFQEMTGIITVSQKEPRFRHSNVCLINGYLCLGGKWKNEELLHVGSVQSVDSRNL
jgi:hypothetical protein